MQLPIELQQAPQGMLLAADNTPRTPGFTPACTPAQHLFARSAGMLLISFIGGAPALNGTDRCACLCLILLSE